MARFKPASETTVAPIATSARLPFQNIYGSTEGEYVYVNMEAVDGLRSGMRTLRDIGVIVDISGSMGHHYDDGSVSKLVSQIVDAMAWADDDGIDIFFFANGLVHQENVKSAGDVQSAVNNAIKARGAFGTTMPTAAFRKFVDQCKTKGRAATVLFLTDGAMDDGGKELVDFYKNYLHNEFRTRDEFYCYAVEFGHNAKGALNVLDGLFTPEQGPEDLFDLDNADNLAHIADVLKQVGGMSAVGSDVSIKASVDNGTVIDMVNADLIPGGQTTVEGAINQYMSFRVLANNAPFTLRIEVPGYDAIVAKVTPNGWKADISVA